MIFKNMMLNLFVWFYQSTDHRPPCCFHYLSVSDLCLLMFMPMYNSFPWRVAWIYQLASKWWNAVEVMGYHFWNQVTKTVAWVLDYLSDSIAHSLCYAVSCYVGETLPVCFFLTLTLLPYLHHFWCVGGEECFFDTNNSLWYQLGVINSIQFWHQLKLMQTLRLRTQFHKTSLPTPNPLPTSHTNQK